MTSKIFEPTEEETAMSPNPLRATIILVNKSGMEVPAAKNVRPITCKERIRRLKTQYFEFQKVFAFGILDLESLMKQQCFLMINYFPEKSTKVVQLTHYYALC